MRKWYINKIVEIDPNSRTIKVLFTDGLERWIKTYDIEGSCIPTTIIEEHEDSNTENN